MPCGHGSGPTATHSRPVVERARSFLVHYPGGYLVVSWTRTRKSSGARYAIRATNAERLWVLPSGSRRTSAPELLTSQHLLEVVGELRNRFDVVIVDSAPLGAGIDAFALATATRNLVLVMRNGKTNRKLAEAKLRILDRLPVNVLGAVLNGIRAEGIYQYYGYLSDYSSEPDEPPVDAVADAEVGAR